MTATAYPQTTIEGGIDYVCEGCGAVVAFERDSIAQGGRLPDGIQHKRCTSTPCGWLSRIRRKHVEVLAIEACDGQLVMFPEG